MADWQPIATAPKDQVIDVFCNGKRYANVHRTSDKGWGAWANEEGAIIIHEHWNWPTHWAPLPEPPK